MRVRASDHRDTYTLERLLGGKTGLLQRVEFTTRSRDVGDVITAKVVPSTEPEELGVTDVSRDLAAIGKGATKQEALQSAVGEYIERYCAFSGLPESVLSRTSYEAMTSGAPSTPDFDTIRHYTDEQYRDIGTEPFTRETRVTWATGTELTAGGEIALPLWLASSRNKSPHGFTSSNGCAAGQSLAGAAYRGLLEVVERDALMRCWYTRATPDRLRLDDFPTLGRLRDECEPAEGRIELLSLESDLPFETVGAAFVGAAESRPKFLVAASARLRVEDAVRDALEEISQQIQMYRRSFATDDPELEPDRPLDLDENGVYYAEPENFEVVERLVSGGETAPMADDDSVPTGTAARLQTALEAFEAASMDVALYEVTDPPVAEAGIRVVKMVVPQLAPLCHPERPAAAHKRLPDDAVQCEPHPVP